MNQLTRTNATPWARHSARCSTGPLPIHRPHIGAPRAQHRPWHRPGSVKPQQLLRCRVASDAAPEVAEEVAPEEVAAAEVQHAEWGEGFERDWEGELTDAHASEPEDLGFAALCSLILLLAVGIFAMTRPAARSTTAQYVTRQPNITLIIEKDSSTTSPSTSQPDGQTSGQTPPVNAPVKPRDALEEDSQDFLHTADDIRPSPDMHASLEQQLGPPPSGPPSAFPHDHNSLFTDSEEAPPASISQPTSTITPEYPLDPPSTSYTAFPDDPYPEQNDLDPTTTTTPTTPHLPDPSPTPSYLTAPAPDPSDPLLPSTATPATIDTPFLTPTASSPTATAPLPHLEAEQPSHAVELSELQDLSPSDTSLENMRERVRIATRASAAASEASHRASAYSAAASSAASKAAEAAERATVATSALQRALEQKSEEAISSAEARMARALELAGDAEGRAASAAALATAYQDIAQTQASVAEQVSTVATKASTTVPAGGLEAAAAAKSNQLPFLQGLQGQWRLARWQLQHALEFVVQSWGAAAASVARVVTAAVINPLLGLWSWLVAQF